MPVIGQLKRLQTSTTRCQKQTCHGHIRHRVRESKDQLPEKKSIFRQSAKFPASICPRGGLRQDTRIEILGKAPARPRIPEEKKKNISTIQMRMKAEKTCKDIFNILLDSENNVPKRVLGQVLSKVAKLQILLHCKYYPQ